MDSKEAFSRLTKEQVIHLIIWQMFTKEISLEELTKRIKGKELEIVDTVNKHLNEVTNGLPPTDESVGILPTIL